LELLWQRILNTFSYFIKHILVTSITSAAINNMPLIQFMALIQCNVYFWH